MSELLFPLPTPAVPIHGQSRLFPVRRIFCVGRNYAAHAREMGADPNREPPFFFMKPADAILPGGGRIPYPRDTANLHHEVELVVALRAGGADIAREAALDCVYGYAVGLDLTRRDRQNEAKEKGHPWERGKAFDGSAPISPIVAAEACGHPSAGRVTLSVNGSERQAGDLADMIWPVADIIAKLSQSWRLAAGDLIFTGTPEGVGALAFGDVVDARIEGLGGLRVEIGSGKDA